MTFITTDTNKIIGQMESGTPYKWGSPTYNASLKQTYIDDLNAHYDQQYAPVEDEPLIPMGKDLPPQLKEITPEVIYEKVISELVISCSINKLYYNDTEVVGVNYTKHFDMSGTRPEEGDAMSTINALLGNIRSSDCKNTDRLIEKYETFQVELVLADKTTVNLTKFENFSRRKIESVII